MEERNWSMARGKDKHYLFFKSDTKVMENAI